MNRTEIVCKARNLADLKKIIKDNGIQKEDIVIEKKIILTANEYESLCENFYDRREYIVENGNIMYKDNAGWHCILVTTKGADTGLAISSEGFDFPRYVGEVKLDEVTVNPPVKIKWGGKEETDEILENFNVKIIKLFGEYVLDQSRADKEIRLNLQWQNHKAIWSIKIFSNPEIMCVKDMTSYIGKLVKYKYALKRLREIGLRYEVGFNE